MMDPGGGRTLLDPTDLKITQGMKYGLVGKNGYGVYFFLFFNFTKRLKFYSKTVTKIVKIL